MNVERKTELALQHLGFMGRMLSGSKSGYCKANPHHRAFFNANVYDSAANKLWYGDIDLNRPADSAGLRALVTALGEPVYVTREMPFRFDGATAQSLQSACLGEFPSAVRIDP